MNLKLTNILKEYSIVISKDLKLLPILLEYLKESNQSNEINNKLKYILSIVKQELQNYQRSENYDDRWFELRDELRRLNQYFEDGYFLAKRGDEEIEMNDFLKDIDYSNNYTYKKGEQVRKLETSNSGFKNSNLPVYKAIGDKTLFRGVSLKDWNRIKNQGFIDSDMRGAILETEGINLGQTPNTASYYLPNNNDGVILAISPKGLDLYMLDDEYIRVFEPIPIKNVIKVSSIISKNKIGGIVTKNTEKKIIDMVNRLKSINVEIK
jgi:hypothetical protein